MTAHTAIVDPETAYGLRMAALATGENARLRAVMGGTPAVTALSAAERPAPTGIRPQERRKMDRREKLLAALRLRGHARAASLAEEFGCRDELILTDLRDLLADGLVEREQIPMHGNPGSTVLWRIAEAKA